MRFAILLIVFAGCSERIFSPTPELDCREGFVAAWEESGCDPHLEQKPRSAHAMCDTFVEDYFYCNDIGIACEEDYWADEMDIEFYNLGYGLGADACESYPH